MRFIGVDYSITCPSICVYSGNNEFNYSDCVFHYLTDKKKYEINTKKFQGLRYPIYEILIERYTKLGQWAANIIKSDLDCVFLEGYSYGSHMSRIFDIGEATGILKHLLYGSGVDLNIVPPTKVKKFATGKGNATKIMMFDAFKKETGVDLYSDFKCSICNSPVSDIIDSYYICKYAKSQHKI